MTLRELAARVAGTFGRGRRDDEVAEELAFHREQLEEAHRRRGLPPEAARQAARAALGGHTQTMEAFRDQRGLPWFDMLQQDVRYGVRMLRRTPGFTTAALLTLAIGTGANAAIFAVVNAVLLRPLPFPNASRVVIVGDRGADGQVDNVGFETAADWRVRSNSFAQIALMRSWTPTLIAAGEAERLEGVRVSANYFETIGLQPALGRAFSEAEDTPEGRRVVILSDAIWRRRFNADPAVVGRSVQIADVNFRIVGVMPAGFDPLDAKRYEGGADVWAPLGYRIGGDSTCRSCQHLRAFGLLAPHVSVANAAAEMNAIRAVMQREHPTEYSDGTIAVVPLDDALMGEVRRPLYVLLGAVGFVLLIACANVANLLLARSQSRARELAVRAVLGAGSGRLLRQMLTESTLLALGGGAAALLLASGAVHALERIAPVSLPRADRAGVDGVVVLFTLVVSLVTGTLFGVLPALRAARGALSSHLAVDSRSSVGGTGRLRSALVIADLALALVLLAGAGVMLRTTMALIRVPPGFQPDRLLTWQLSLAGNRYAEDAAVVQFQETFLQKLHALPGVTGAALADQIPFGTNYDCRGFHVRGLSKQNSAEDPCIERYGTTADYLQVMGIPLRDGRFFTAADTARSQPVIVVSEATRALVWGDANPIGSQVRFGSAIRGPWYTVIGVVGDVHHSELDSPAAPAFYSPESQFTDSDLVAIVRSTTADPAALAPAARQILRDIDPGVAMYDVATLESRIGDAIQAPRFVTQMLAGFAAIALLLAAVGLYGVVSFGVSQRTRELAVRIALGATPRQVLRMILSSGAALILIGVVTGIVAAGLTTRLLGSLVFGVTPSDPMAFTASVGVLVAVAGAAHVLPALRALAIDPARALRQD
ncbi:MAG TPA: ABC transporter permease [Vicinamibacterales bacterium]|nr:ABC transporter permease [Vicinamibacterales bacterium]